MNSFGLRLSAAALLIPALVFAQRTIYVDGTSTNCPGTGSASNPFCRIQTAIQSAGNGDTVLVLPSTYRENLDFLGKAIAVRGREGSRLTILDAGQSGSGVVFDKGEGPASILAGFTIQNGTGTLITIFSGSGVAGGGILCRQTSPTISQVVLTSNQAGYGGGIGGVYASPVLTDVVMRGNVATANGGGACFMFSSKPLLTGCSFTGNSCGHTGGGLNFRNDSFPVLVNCLFDANWATDMGGAIRAGALSGCVITNCTFHRNSSVYGGAVAAGSDTVGNIQTTLIRNSIFWNNTANFGPDLSLNGGYPAIIDIAHSDVGAGQASVYVQSTSFVLVWGAGMLTANPGFVDAATGDFHLRHPSPCRDAGTNLAANLPTTDSEGDPRIAYATADMGADEFFTHLYHTGNPTPGGTIANKITGIPSTQALWLAAPSVVTPPVQIPGIGGALHLDLQGMLVVPLGMLPPDGFVTLPFQFPLGFPRVAIPTQALTGLQLSNLEVVRVY